MKSEQTSYTREQLTVTAALAHRRGETRLEVMRELSEELFESGNIAARDLLAGMIARQEAKLEGMREVVELFGVRAADVSRAAKEGGGIPQSGGGKRKKGNGGGGTDAGNDTTDGGNAGDGQEETET